LNAEDAKDPQKTQKEDQWVSLCDLCGISAPSAFKKCERANDLSQINRSSDRVIFFSGLLRPAGTLSGMSVCASSHTGSSRLSNTSRNFCPHALCSMR
jgi:hypothetical protein